MKLMVREDEIDEALSRFEKAIMPNVLDIYKIYLIVIRYPCKDCKGRACKVEN